MKIIRAMTGAKTEVDWFITLYGNDLRYTKVKLVDRANFRKEFDQEYNIYLLVFQFQSQIFERCSKNIASTKHMQDQSTSILAPFSDLS